MFKRIRQKDIVIYIVSFVFFLFFAIFDGYNLYSDSSSYILMSEIREPLYPLFIALIRLIFGFLGDNYLLVVVIVQSLVLAIAISKLTIFIKNKYELNDLVTILIFLIQIGICLSMRFLSKRGVMFSNAILSEGLAISLFILFFKNILSFNLDKDKKSLILSIVYSFLLVSTRKQMIVSLVLILISIIFIYFKDIKKMLICLLVSLIVVMGGSYVLDVCYMKITHNIDGTHTSSNRFLTTMVVYTSEREDVSLIKDQDTKELFNKIYDVCSEKGYLKNSVSNDANLYDRTSHFSDVYDSIQIDTMWPIIREFAKTKTTGDNVEVLVDKYNSEIVKSLLPSTIGKIILTFIDSFVIGLMITISADKEIFIIYSLLAYVVYIVLLVLTIKKKGIFNKYSIIGLLTLLSTLVNVAIVSLVIFNQTRYTIYNMSLFYIAGLLMLYNIVVNKKKES